MEIQEVQTETAAAVIVQAMSQQHREVGGVPLFLAPNDFKTISLEALLPAPARKRGITELNDAESFIAVVNDQKTDATRLYSTVNPPTFTAVFNHTAKDAGWCDHIAKYNAPLSPEWKTWAGIDGKTLSQVEVAHFLETNLVDVTFIEPSAETGEKGSPDGATLLEMCRTLEAKKKVDFKSSTRLSDGSTQFTYNEDVQGSAMAGTMTIPEQFSIGIPVFENGDKWRVDVRLRFRINDGQLRIWFELVRPHKVVEVAVKELREAIAKGTELQVLNGSPISPVKAIS